MISGSPSVAQTFVELLQWRSIYGEIHIDITLTQLTLSYRYPACVKALYLDQYHCFVKQFFGSNGEWNARKTARLLTGLYYYTKDKWTVETFVYKKNVEGDVVEHFRSGFGGREQ